VEVVDGENKKPTLNLVYTLKLYHVSPKKVILCYKNFRPSYGVLSASPSSILSVAFQTHNHFLNTLKHSKNFTTFLKFTVFLLVNTSFRYSDLMLLLL